MAQSCIHFDPSSGISGDMTLGALIDLGVDLSRMEQELAKLSLSGITIQAERVQYAGIDATHCRVRTAESRVHRHLAHIEKIIQESMLDDWVKIQSQTAFRRLAEAEAKVHRQPIEKIHFHEVGALDAIVDVVGSMIGFHLLGVRQFSSGPVNVGGGEVRCDHGLLPVPAPATAELLKGIPIRGDAEAGELTTPTGAAILTTLCRQFGDLPMLRIQAIGYGAGTRISQRRPNLLRLILGELEVGASIGPELDNNEKIVVLETTIDDLSPQITGFLCEKVLQCGALDAFITPVQMKKSRPGMLLTVLSTEQMARELLSLIFLETSTLGIRFRIEDRAILQRSEVAVKIPGGQIRLKVALWRQRVINVMAEYEDCCKVAEATGLPLKVIQARALHEYMKSANEPYGWMPQGES